MPEKTDKEREVLQAILTAFDQVSEEGRERILRTVSTFYELDLFNGPRVIRNEPRPGERIATNDRRLSFADHASISPKEFLHEKQPKTGSERVACLAYYLTHYRETPHFKTIDISQLNTEAAQLKFSNPNLAVKDAIIRGMLAPAAKGARQISAIGERFIDALPNRDAAKAAFASMSRLARRKKSAKTKKPRKASK